MNSELHLFEADGRPHVFVTNGSRVYELDDAVFSELKEALASGNDSTLQEVMFRVGLDAPPYITNEPTSVPFHAVSLAVSQKCNLGCTYCYAEGGSFGGAAKNMTLDVAIRTVDALFMSAQPGSRLNLAFLGGEPLVNRTVLRSATEHAKSLAAAKNCIVGFSITTNGTLITPEDIDFLAHNNFSVTISLDGIGETHDRQRPFLGGKGSFNRIIERITPLLARDDVDVAARVTVTPNNLDLLETLDGLLGKGFRSVGFSPMLASPNGSGEMKSEELGLFLNALIECGNKAERQLEAGQPYGFSNLLTALQEIHRGSHRPYPCGAGAGYFGASADGELFACHRFVGSENERMGSIHDGIDDVKVLAWMTERHVHRQEPCQTCWARYLCGGGCHHEVIRRGRPACDYIRGWLHYCLSAYARLLTQRPDLFQR
jgi:uncharacterized protein